MHCWIIRNKNAKFLNPLAKVNNFIHTKNIPKLEKNRVAKLYGPMIFESKIEIKSKMATKRGKKYADKSK